MSADSHRPVLGSCFDASYLPHVAASVASLADSTECRVTWYLAADDSVDDPALGELASFASSLGIEARPIRIPAALIEGFADFPPYPRTVWNRIALAEALPDEDRLIYLDGDVLVLQDLGPLWATALDDGENLLGAVAQPTYSDISDEHVRLGRPFDAPYLNTGVLIFDLARMRAENVLEAVRSYAASRDRPRLRTPEQDALNLLFPDRWLRLDPRWNCLTSIAMPFIFAGASWSDDLTYDPVTLERAARSPAIVHFEGLPKLKPWHVRSFHPATELYRSYRATTPWPLRALEGSRKDEMLARIPPRAQARIWQAAASVRRG